MPRYGKNIKNRILFFVSLTVTLAFLLMGYMVYAFIRDYAQDKARLIAEISIKNADDSISLFFGDLKKLAGSLATNPALTGRAYRETGRILISIARARNRYVNSVYFASSDGVFLQRGWGSKTFRTNGGWAFRNLPFRVNYPPLLPSSYDARKRPWYRFAIRKKATIITDPYPFAGGEKGRSGYGITVAAPVYRDGRIIGVVGIDCTLSTLQHFISNSQIPQGGRLIVFGPNREVLVNPFHKETTWKAIHRSLRIDNMGALFKKGRGSRITSILGTKMVIAHTFNTGSRFTLLAAFPYRELMRSGVRMFSWIAAISVISLVILVFILNIGLRRLVGPIRGLTRTIERFSSRDFSARAEVSERMQGTEFGKLATTFNEMARAIKEYDNTLLKQLYQERITELPNRHRLLLDITNIRHPVLFLANINGFKEINDFYGTAVGDSVLKQVGQRLSEAMPDGKTYKLPGDEYALLFNQQEDHDPEATAKSVRRSIESSPVICMGTDVVVHITLGVAFGDNSRDTRNYETIMLHADMALKRARQRLIPFLIYDESLKIMQEYENNLIWVKRFREAVFEDRIIPVFQPIVHNQTTVVEKYECLVRIRDTEGRLIPPGEFLETARRARLYHELTRAMTRKSLEHFRARPFEFSINISAEDILNTETNEYLHTIMEAEPELCNRLVFELTETQEIESYSEVKDFLLHAKEHGAKVAIDDFGTGYSNFGYILELHVDYIKIDASLIKNIDTNPDSEIIVTTIASFAKRLGIKTIAEYVHNESVFRKVRSIGIDYSQGFYFGKPVETAG